MTLPHGIANHICYYFEQIDFLEVFASIAYTPFMFSYSRRLEVLDGHSMLDGPVKSSQHQTFLRFNSCRRLYTYSDRLWLHFIALRTISTQTNPRIVRLTRIEIPVFGRVVHVAI